MKNVHLYKVADLNFKILFTDNSADESMLPSFTPFKIYDAEDTIFNLSVGEYLTPFETDAQLIGKFNCGGADHEIFKRLNSGYIIRIYSPEGVLSCVLHTDECFKHCEASVYNNSDNKRFGLNNAIMICFSFSGAAQQVLMIHASVPMLKDKAYLFLGKSGTGKSTHCKLWLNNIEGADLLNDDNPAVRILSNGDIKVYGTPWSGKTPCYRPISRNVGGFLKLEQFPKNIINQLPPVQAMAEVLASCSVMIWDKRSYQMICETVIKIVQHIGVWHLKNLPNIEACRMSYQAMVHDDENNKCS